MPEQVQKKVLFDEPGASLEAQYDGERVLLVDRQDPWWQSKTEYIRIIPLTTAQAVEFADWVKAVVSTVSRKG